MKKLFNTLSVVFLLMICFLTETKAQTFDWAFSVPGSGNNPVGGNFLNDIAVDTLGNIYVLGAFYGNLDFDPSPSTFLLQGGGTSPTNYLSTFIAKYDSAMNLVWAHVFGGEGGGAKAIEMGYANEFYITGNFIGTVDFGTNGNQQILISDGNNAKVFLAKFDTEGNSIWAEEIYGFGTGYDIAINNVNDILVTGCATNGQRIFFLKCDGSGANIWTKTIGSGSFNSNIGKAIVIDAQNNIYLAGEFFGIVDFDPSVNTVNITPHNGPYDIFLAKYDSSGNYKWAIPIGTSTPSSQDIVNGMEIDNYANLFLTGTIKGTVDFDPGVGIANIIPNVTNGMNTYFVAKYDSAGNYKWANKVYCQVGSEGFSIALDNSGQVYTTGTVEEYQQLEGENQQSDFDSGPGIANPEFSNTTGNTISSFISKYSTNGHYIFAKGIGGNGGFGSVWNDVIKVDNQGNIIIAGMFSDTSDFNADTNEYNLYAYDNRDIFIAKYKQSPCDDVAFVISGNTELTCNNLGYVEASIEGGAVQYQYTWNTIPPTNTGPLFVTESGVYTVTASEGSNCSFTRDVLIIGANSLTDVDLDGNLVATSFRFNRYSKIWLDVFNDGCVPATGNIKLPLSPYLTYQNATPPPTQIIGDTLIWAYTDLIYDSAHVTPVIDVLTTSGVAGDTVRLPIIITIHQGEIDTINNTKTYEYPILQAIDPNDKHVYPQGVGAEGFIKNNQLMTYMVRFQNTGNAEAIDVYIVDTLDPNLNLQTLRVVGASHNMITEIYEGKEIHFIFHNINLPDSTTNEPESHGYVIFEVEQNPNLPAGTEIRNTSYIFFDYNEAVITNTVLNTIEECTIQQATVSVSENVLTCNELNVSYQWVDCNNGNSQIQGATARSYIAPNNGSYAVIIENAFGCTNISDCNNIIITGEKNAEKNLIKVFPNPVQTEIIISGLNSHYLKLINTLGQIVLEANKTNRLYVGNLPQGLYLLQLFDEKGGLLKTDKIIKK